MKQALCMFVLSPLVPVQLTVKWRACGLLGLHLCVCRLLLGDCWRPDLLLLLLLLQPRNVLLHQHCLGCGIRCL